MIIFQNENILGLIFKNFTLREANRLHNETKNKTFSKFLLRSLNFEAIYKSIGKTTIRLVGHKFTPISVALMPDGSVISVSNIAFKLWDINNYTCIRTVRTFVELIDVFLLVLSDSTVITYSQNNHIQLWDVKVESRCTKVIRLSKYKPVKTNPIILANGYLAVSVDLNRTASIMILDLYKDDGNNIINVLTEHTYHLYSFFVNLTNNTFASVSYENISIWDINNNYNCIRSLTGQRSKVMAASEKYNLLISGSSDSTSRIFNMDTLKYLASFNSSQDNIDFVQFVPGGYFLSACFYCIKFWEIKNYQCINTIEPQIDIFQYLLVLKDKRVLTCPTRHSDIIIYNY
jgi:WD40 repeat protein